MIVYGIYDFFRRRLAYRIDWCLSCEVQLVRDPDHRCPKCSVVRE